MEGIAYLTNSENEKIAVQIDLSKYGNIWEDFLDLIVANEREIEEKIPLDDVITDLKSADKLDRDV